MTKGVATFLATRGPAEAWVTVKKVLEEEGFVQRAAAARLGVHDRTLYLWLKKNDYMKELKKLRADALFKKIT